MFLLGHTPQTLLASSDGDATFLDFQCRLENQSRCFFIDTNVPSLASAYSPQPQNIMKNGQTITLDKLHQASLKDGIVAKDNLRIKAPVACVQTNAPGSLGCCKDVESFRNEGVKLGEKYRQVLVG